MKEEVVDAIAQQMLSVFAVAMMVGRLRASQIGFITTHGDLIIAVVALVAASVILAMTKTGAIWTSALIACAGLFFAPCRDYYHYWPKLSSQRQGWKEQQQKR